MIPKSNRKWQLVEASSTIQQATRDPRALEPWYLTFVSRNRSTELSYIEKAWDNWGSESDSFQVPKVPKSEIFDILSVTMDFSLALSLIEEKLFLPARYSELPVEAKLVRGRLPSASKHQPEEKSQVFWRFRFTLFGFVGVGTSDSEVRRIR